MMSTVRILPPRTSTPPSSDNSDGEPDLGLARINAAKVFQPEIRFNFSPPPSAGVDENGGFSDSPKASELTPALSAGEFSPTGSRNGRLSPDSARLPPGGVGPDGRKLFNFGNGSPVAKSHMASRRGHRYKHSSVSHDIFVSPPPRAPLALPASLPIPTAKEYWASLTREQSYRVAWCACHAAVAALVLWSAEGSLSVTALSHLVLFDALGSMLCIFVDVNGNFEVWKRSSVRHPFGLERIQVLAGFVMSVLLLFMGLDLISHNLQHILEHLGTHEPHRSHHEPGGSTSYTLPCLVTLAATFASAVLLDNHRRIGEIMKLRSKASRFPSWMSNPTHVLTSICVILVLILPNSMDQLVSSSIALSMVLLGGFLVTVLASILLMASPKAVVTSNLMREIENEPRVVSLLDARFWTVHHGLGIATVKVMVRSDGDGEAGIARTRERVATLVRNTLGGGIAGKIPAMRWEVTTEVKVLGGDN